jgi:hypothetical protein
MPEYYFDDHMAIYIEKNHPPSSIYEKVGYNDQATVQVIMDGTDEERRAIDASKNRERGSRLSSRPSNDEKSLDFTIDRYDAKTQTITNMHYRKFYKTELENIKTLFPAPIFDTIKIFKGASRGTKATLFSAGTCGQTSHE